MSAEMIDQCPMSVEMIYQCVFCVLKRCKRQTLICAVDSCDLS